MKEADSYHNIPVPMMVCSEKGESQAGWRKFSIQRSKNKELLHSINNGFVYSDRWISKSYICDKATFFYKPIFYLEIDTFWKSYWCHEKVLF